MQDIFHAEMKFMCWSLLHSCSQLFCDPAESRQSLWVVSIALVRQIQAGVWRCEWKEIGFRI